MVVLQHHFATLALFRNMGRNHISSIRLLYNSNGEISTLSSHFLWTMEHSSSSSFGTTSVPGTDILREVVLPHLPSRRPLKNLCVCACVYLAGIHLNNTLPSLDCCAAAVPLNPRIHKKIPHASYFCVHHLFGASYIQDYCNEIFVFFDLLAVLVFV